MFGLVIGMSVVYRKSLCLSQLDIRIQTKSRMSSHYSTIVTKLFQKNKKKQPTTEVFRLSPVKSNHQQEPPSQR